VVGPLEQEAQGLFGRGSGRRGVGEEELFGLRRDGQLLDIQGEWSGDGVVVCLGQLPEKSARPASAGVVGWVQGAEEGEGVGVGAAGFGGADE
jgi:hypothetical protein